MELSTEPGSSPPLRRQIQFEQGYYWCHIVHQHQPAAEDQQEFCLSLIHISNRGQEPGRGRHGAYPGKRPAAAVHAEGGGKGRLLQSFQVFPSRITSQPEVQVE